MRTLLKILCNWWRQDRVRIAPGEGRLLRLSPGDLIMINGEPFEILERAVSGSEDTATVTYDCLSPTGAFQLSIRPAAPGRALLQDAGHATEANNKRFIAADDIQVWNRSSHR